MAGDDKRLGLAAVYAQAILRLAEERGEAERVLEELEALGSWLAEHPGERENLASPLADAARRRQSLDRMFRARISNLLLDALQVMNKNHRLELLEPVAEAYRQEYQRRHGLVDVQVTSALPLSDAQRQSLQEAARERTGSTARLLESVDPRLLGGLVIEIGDQKFDASVRRQLERLGQDLVERASQEILRGRSHDTEAKS